MGLQHLHLGFIIQSTTGVKWGAQEQAAAHTVGRIVGPDLDGSVLQKLGWGSSSRGKHSPPGVSEARGSGERAWTLPCVTKWARWPAMNVGAKP